jgi:hypothetical protein
MPQALALDLSRAVAALAKLGNAVFVDVHADNGEVIGKSDSQR